MQIARMARMAALALIMGSGLPAGAARAEQGAQAAPIGRWLTADRSGVIEISHCGAYLCGWIVGMRDWPPSGVPRDVYGRPECGLAIIQHLAPADGNRWQGRITDPDDGRSYGAELWRDREDRLHLRGYVAIPLLGSTQIWTPYAGPVSPDCRVA